MAWEVWAQGKGLTDFGALVPDQNLPKGTRARIVMDLSLPVGSAFDVAGAEHVFRAFVPDGMEMVDVWGEGNWQGIVEMESDPIFLAPLLAFLASHWVAIAVGGLLLTMIISSITLLVSAPKDVAHGFGLGLGKSMGLIVLAGGAYLLLKSGNRKVPEG